MTKTIIGIFDKKKYAEKAITKLKHHRHNPKNISVVVHKKNNSHNNTDINGALRIVGIAKSEATSYEDKIRHGAVLLAVPTQRNDETDVKIILKDYHAKDIKEVVGGMNTGQIL